MSTLHKKLLLLAVCVAAIVTFISFDLDQYISLSLFRDWVEREPYIAAAVYVAIYLTVASLSLPGSGPLTVIGGGVFGLWYGLLLVSFASTIGATIAMFISRTLLQEWVQKRFTDTIVKVNKGIEKDGIFYLLTLRCIPAVPFFVVNLVFGLTKMRLSTFYIVSQIGMIPGTFIYVNFGAELGEVENFTLENLLTFEIIGALVLLGCFPFLIKFVINKIQGYRDTQRQET